MNKLIRALLNNAKSVIGCFLVFMLIGLWALSKTPVDAIPDLSENQVIVMTSWPGQTPKNIEDQITYPLSSQLSGLIGVKDVRASSIIGLSLVTVIFEDDIDVYFARDRVTEKLGSITNQLPENVTPVLGPDATGLGQIFMYTIEGDLDLYQKRSLQDFQLNYALQSVPGVSEVAPIGGYVKQYQIDIDPYALHAHDIRLQDVMRMIKRANNNVSGKVISLGEKEISLQGIGFLQSIDDLRSVTLKIQSENDALTLDDVADIRIGPAFRRSILANEEEEKVGGIVVMRYGENPLEVINGVKKRIAEIEPTLPEGVYLKSFYDRSSLIQSAIKTLKDVLVEEILIVTLVVGIFLWHRRSILVILLAIPISVLMAFVCMYLFKIPSNIMSLGGIAIVIGEMTDAAIVITENIHRKLASNNPQNINARKEIVHHATMEVISPIMYSILIIIIAFIPVFLLEGMEGKLFHPLAFTKTFSMIGALITTIFLIPVLCYVLFSKNLKKEENNPLMKKLQNVYNPILNWALNHKKKVLAGSGIILTLALGSGLFLGSEFMPPLNEGSIMYMPVTVPEVSESRARELLLETNKIIASHPEVESVVGKAGRAISATDPAPLSMIESFITLKPKSEWRWGVSKESIIRELNQSIQIDKLWNGFTQPIIGRIEMLSTGIRSEVGIKIFGDDPRMIEEIAIEAERIVSEVPGATDVSALRTIGVEYLNIDIDEVKIRAHNIDRGNILDLVSIGAGGMDISQSIQGREQYPIQLRYKEAYRDSTADIESLVLSDMQGRMMTLRQVASIQREVGPSVLHSENGILRGVVQLNVDGRDLVGFVNEAKKVLEEKLELPNSYRVEWDGQYKKHLEAKKRLTIIVPIVLLIIFFFLYLTYHQISLALLILLSIPISLAGGFISLFLAGMNLSVAVWVGFISLFGIAAETAVVMAVYLENSYKQRARENGFIEPKKLKEAIHEGATLRLRPKMMTVATSIMGLAPMVLSSGTGAEVTRPLAIVMMGGLVTSTFMILIVLPAAFQSLKLWQNKRIST